MRLFFPLSRSLIYETEQHLEEISVHSSGGQQSKKKVINGFELAVFPLRQSRAHKSLREYKVLDSISPNWEQKKEK